MLSHTCQAVPFELCLSFVVHPPSCAGFGTSVALSAAMAARFLRTGKVMPAGVLMFGGAAGGLYNWGKYQEWTKG